MYALDTNTLIDFFRQSGRITAHLQLTPASQIHIPSVVWLELEYGLLRSHRPEAQRRGMEAVARAYALVHFDRQSAQAAAMVKHTLDTAGTPIGHFDLLIAGTALAHQLTLVTRNTREFERVPGLWVENWYD